MIVMMINSPQESIYISTVLNSLFDVELFGKMNKQHTINDNVKNISVVSYHNKVLNKNRFEIQHRSR